MVKQGHLPEFLSLQPWVAQRQLSMQFLWGMPRTKEISINWNWIFIVVHNLQNWENILSFWRHFNPHEYMETLIRSLPRIAWNYVEVLCIPIAFSKVSTNSLQKGNLLKDECVLQPLAAFQSHYIPTAHLLPVHLLLWNFKTCGMNP